MGSTMPTCANRLFAPPRAESCKVLADARQWCSLALVVLLLPAVVRAAGYRSMLPDLRGESAGGTIFTFLTIPVGARQLALGGAASPANGDATDVSFAVANTAFMDRYQFAVTHLEWPMGLRKEYAGACFPIFDVGSVGFHTQVFTYGGFEDARNINEAPSDIGAVDFAAGISFARPFLSDRLGAGLVVSYIQSVLDGEAAAAVSCNAEALYTPVHWLSSRLFVRNAGSPARYTEARELQPLEAGVALCVSPVNNDRDTTAEGPRVAPVFHLGAVKTADDPVRAGIGAEVKIVDQFFVRTGYEYAHGRTPSVEGLSAGIGFTLGKYGMDAGWKLQSREFGSAWNVTVRVSADELRPKTAMEYYLVAEAFFRKGNNRQAVRSARKALSLNPNLWQAHSLLARIASTVRRDKGLEIGLIYTGNVGGELAPQQAGEISLGGIARSATAIATLRSEYPLCLAIDAGNLVSGASTPEQAAVALKYAARVGYGALGIGSGEIMFGLDNYRLQANAVKTELVCTNLARRGQGTLTDVAIVSVGEYRVAVLDMVEPALLGGAGGLWLEDPIEALKPRLATLLVRNSNLRILIYHGPWESLRKHEPSLKGIDIVLCGSLQQRFGQPMRVGGATVLSAGGKGHYVGALTLRFNDTGKLVSFDNRLVPLTNQIEEDPATKQEVERVMPGAGVARPDSAVTEAIRAGSDGVFPIVSDRSGAPQIYLKVLQKHAEFPIAAGPISCTRPRLSLTSGRLVYFARPDSLTPEETPFVKDLLRGTVRPLGFSGAVDEVCFHPAGAWIYAAVRPGSDTAAQIHRSVGEGGGSMPVVAWEGVSTRWVSVSPDGANLVFSATIGTNWHVYMADTAGATPIQITEAPANHINARVSPDGRYLAYLSDRSSLAGKFDLWVQDRGSGAEGRLTTSMDVGEFCWYDDSRTLVYGSGASSRALHTVDVGLAHSTPLTHREPADGFDEYSPMVVRHGGRSRIVYVRAYASGARHLHWIDIDGTEDRKISESTGSEWLE